MATNLKQMLVGLGSFSSYIYLFISYITVRAVITELFVAY